MAIRKTVSILSITILVIAGILRLDCMFTTRQALMETINSVIFRNKDRLSSTSTGSVTKLFSKEELAGYKGHNGGAVYLAIVGSVFDVSKGRKHYGPGGGYEFFAGIDASKSFVTGNFEGEGLTDDISDLSPSQFLSLEGWKSFYEKDYSFIGVVQGAFYDKNGDETDNMRFYRKQLNLANKEKDLIENDRQLFPPCNSEWSQNKGSRVWCTELSGGVKRDWEGVPRMYFTLGSSKPRCACVRETGPPSHDPSAVNHKNNGDLDNPNLTIYPDCEPNSKSCVLRDH